MTQIMMTFKAKVQAWCRQTYGAIAIVFALTAPVIIGSAGMAVDYASAYLVQQRLAQAVDAAALAGAATSTDQASITQKVNEFFAINFPPEKLGVTLIPEVYVTGGQVKVKGNATYETMFLSVIGIEYINVEAQTIVQREVKGLEVVLVLDNTGSMSDFDNISKLRTAACEFVEILYGTYDSEATEDCLDRYDDYVEAKNSYIKVGLVPYSTSVNVGSYGFGFDDSGNSYDTAFLNNPQGLTFNNDSTDDICVLEDDDGTDVLDQDGPWDMYRWCEDRDTGDPVCEFIDDYSCVWYDSTGSCLFVQYNPGVQEILRRPEYACPRASILPMTEDMTALKGRIGEMQASGWTFGNIGMVWGWRMLSPDYPFTEGVAWNNTGWRKVIVMMTDGDNVRSSPYGAYGFNDEHSLDSSSDLDGRLEDVCENMDTQDSVTVYTITFEATEDGIDEATETLYENCAANGGRHEHVTESDDLIDVFREIATELSNLHIKS